MNQQEIEAYIAKLPFNAAFTTLAADVRESIIFGSWEMLRRRFGVDAIDSEMAALQSLYVAEGEAEEFAKFKRHGLKSVGLDGISLSIDGSNISPEVIALVEAREEQARLEAEGGGAIFGRLF